MQLYVYPYAPNPLKPIILIGEKALDVQISYIDKTNYVTFWELSPSRRTPVLVLDDRRVISESLTICQYLDETSPAPRLFGETLDERTEIGMWERRAEIEFFNECARVYHNIHPMFRGNISQTNEAASLAFRRAMKFLKILDERLEGLTFVAGHQLSAADITAYIGFFWLLAMGVLEVSELSAGVRRWHEALASRPAFQPLLQMASVLNATHAQRAEA